MPGMSARAGIVGPIVLVTLVLASGCGQRPEPLGAGDPAPGFVNANLQGDMVQFPDDYAGRVVAIRFWADWCPYCKAEMDALEPVHQRLEAQGLTILAINVGQRPKVAQRFVRGLGITYDVVLDEDSKTARRYGVIGLPTTFFVDRSGRIRNKILGESDAETFERLASALL
jgi:peroxiredoxin